MPHVAVSIVAWNSMKHLPDALASVASQTFKDFTLIVVDNASGDGASVFVRERHPEAMVLRNSKNLGTARGHNQAIAHAAAHLGGDGDLFMLVMSPDVVLEPDFLANLMEQIERRPEVGSAGGKRFRMLAGSEDGPAGGERTVEIDSAGMIMSRSRRATERGNGLQDDGGRFARTEEVFGVSGTLALYRVQALESVANEGQAFDEDFFAYEEDVDLAWRLRLAGWQALYVPQAKAYRYRSADETGTGLRALRNRFRESKTVNFLSYRNHFLTMIKNDRFFDALLASPWIIWNEFCMFWAVVAFEMRSLRALPSTLGLLPAMLAKRRATMRAARTPGKEMRKWFL